MSSPLFARKPLHLLLEEMRGENRLRRVLGPVQGQTGGVGDQPAGGIGTAKQTLAWQALMNEELGPEWLMPRLFRIGASSLLTDLERQLYHFITGHYAARGEAQLLSELQILLVVAARDCAVANHVHDQRVLVLCEVGRDRYLLDHRAGRGIGAAQRNPILDIAAVRTTNCSACHRSPN